MAEETMSGASVSQARSEACRTVMDPSLLNVIIKMALGAVSWINHSFRVDSYPDCLPQQLSISVLETPPR